MRIFLSLASICLITFFSCERINSPVLATVDEFEILLNDFKQPYQEFLFKTHQTDNLSNRYALLNSLIDEKLILNYSNNKRISENPQIILKKERAYKQLLLNTYYNSKIIQR